MPEETDVIKPFVGGEPGGRPPVAPAVIPYTGGQVVMSPEAQVAAKAAADWAAANPSFTQAIKKGVNNLDQTSQNNLNELRRQMRSTPPRPATIINLHPWPLTFGATNRFLRSITVPPCIPGQAFAYQHVRGYRTDWEYNEDGSLKFKALLPIQLAAEFVREFSNKDAYGGGVIIYEGEGHPDKVDMVETYDPIGRALTTQHPVLTYDEENRPVQEMGELPIKRKLLEILEEQRTMRNQVYFRKVQEADHNYKLPDGRGKRLITDVHRMMAEMLFAEGVIPVVPEWNLSSRLEQGLSENNCKACGAMVKEEAYKCASCNNIINPFEAYKDGAIEWGHAKMELMTSDEWEQAEEIHAAREKSRHKPSGKADKK